MDFVRAVLVILFCLIVPAGVAGYIGIQLIRASDRAWDKGHSWLAKDIARATENERERREQERHSKRN